MKKKLICAILVGALTLTPAFGVGSLLPGMGLQIQVPRTEDKFPAVNTYPGFGDVKESDWFYDNVKICYETGLLMGSDVGFEPASTLSVVQVAVIAARMNECITGDPIPEAQPGQSWSTPYVDYLKALGVDIPDNLLRGATRLEFVSILSAILPNSVLPAINSVTSIPDCDDPAVLRFYNAGILTGIDGYGTFAPQGTLLRRECAAIVSRVARTVLRLTADLDDYTPFLAANLTPGTVMFQSGVTAKDYLAKVMDRIAQLERRDEGLGVEFNWFHTLQDGTTYLSSVKNGALADLGVTAGDGTVAYENFDVQVFYSRYIDLTGETL